PFSEAWGWIQCIGMPGGKPGLHFWRNRNACVSHCKWPSDARLNQSRVVHSGAPCKCDPEQRSSEIRVFVVRSDVMLQLVGGEKAVELFNWIARFPVGRILGSEVRRQCRQT